MPGKAPRVNERHTLLIDIPGPKEEKEHVAFFEELEKLVKKYGGSIGLHGNVAKDKPKS